MWPFWRHCIAQIESSSNLLKKTEIPSFVTLFTAVNAEPVYFLKITEKEISDGTLTYTWGHLVLPDLRYFKGNYLKHVRSRKISFKKFDILPFSVIITPDEVYDTVSWKLLPGKLPPGWFLPDKSHPENSHQRKFPPRITPTRKISTQDNSHLDNPHPENSHPGQFPPEKFLPRKIPT